MKQKYINQNIFKFILFLLSMICCRFSIAEDIKNTLPDQFIQKTTTSWMAQYQIPGVAIAIYYQNHDYFYNFGVTNKLTQQPVTKNTIFEVASLTKPITATLLGICVQQGKCHLSDSVTQFIPSLAKNKNAAINQVTLQDLATHTSGLPRMAKQLGIDDRTANADIQLINNIQKWQPEYPIGSHYSYSNIGFGLLGEAIANAEGENYENAIKQYVLQPLDMINTEVNVTVNQQNHYAQGYDALGNPALHHVSTPWPGSDSLRSTSADLLQYLKANLGVLNISNQLSAAMGLTLQPYFQVKPHFAQGLAWQLKIKHHLNIINKTGTNAGFNSYEVMLPYQKIAIVVLTNKTGDKPGKIANKILEALVQNTPSFQTNDDNEEE